MNKIYEELEKLNYDFSKKGTMYIADCIYTVYISKLNNKFSLQSDVYPQVSNKYRDSINNIKSAVVYATNKMYYDCDEKVLKKYMEKYVLLKPGPKDVVKAILKKIQ